MPGGERDATRGRGPREKATLAAMAGRISEEIDRPLFKEAAACFCTRALRAAYIMAWISVAESLRSRFSAMAQRKDGQAGKVLKRSRTWRRGTRPRTPTSSTKPRV